MLISKMIQNLKVDEYTTPKPISVNLDTGMDEICSLLTKNNIRHLPVMEGDKVVGIISERDITLTERISNRSDLAARDVMTPDPYVVTTGTLLSEVAFEMSKRKIGSAIVLAPEEESYGIFTSTDALNALIEVLRDQVEPVYGEVAEEVSNRI